jgi:hypothetical protein
MSSQSRAPDGVDAAVHSIQMAEMDAVGDRSSADTMIFELPLRHDVVLALGHPRQRPFPLDPPTSAVAQVFRRSFGMHCMHKVGR